MSARSRNIWFQLHMTHSFTYSDFRTVDGFLKHSEWKIMNFEIVKLYVKQIRTEYHQ